MNRKEKKMKTERMLVFAATLLGAMTADAVDANVRFSGGGYDGYSKQDTATLGIPAIPPKGTMVSFK
ncbi:MAG: hypothetical protein WCP12_02480 [bacterium]